MISWPPLFHVVPSPWWLARIITSYISITASIPQITFFFFGSSFFHFLLKYTYLKRKTQRHTAMSVDNCDCRNEYPVPLKRGLDYHCLSWNFMTDPELVYILRAFYPKFLWYSKEKEIGKGTRMSLDSLLWTFCFILVKYLVSCF